MAAGGQAKPAAGFEAVKAIKQHSSSSREARRHYELTGGDWAGSLMALVTCVICMKEARHGRGHHVNAFTYYQHIHKSNSASPFTSALVLIAIVYVGHCTCLLWLVGATLSRYNILLWGARNHPLVQSVLLDKQSHIIHD